MKSRTVSLEIVGKETSAEEVRRLHKELESESVSAVEKIIRIGGILAEEKKNAGHGNWSKWVVDNLTFSERAAANYMRLFKNRQKLLAPKQHGRALLVLGDALKLVANEPKKDGTPRKKRESKPKPPLADNGEGDKEKPRSLFTPRASDNGKTDPEAVASWMRRKVIQELKIYYSDNPNETWYNAYKELQSIFDEINYNPSEKLKI